MASEQKSATVTYTGEHAGAPWWSVSFGKADGFSADYIFDKGNNFTVEMAEADARKLREFAEAPTFKFRVAGLAD